MRLLFLLTCSSAVAFGQGALPSEFSGYQPTQFEDVRCQVKQTVGLTRGVLYFDARTEMRFVGSNGAEMRIPYAAIRGAALEVTGQPASFGVPRMSQKWQLPFSLGHDRTLKVRYENGTGETTASFVLPKQQSHLIVATLEAKTGMRAVRSGGRQWWR